MNNTEYNNGGVNNLTPPNNIPVNNQYENNINNNIPVNNQYENNINNNIPVNNQYENNINNNIPVNNQMQTGVSKKKPNKLIKIVFIVLGILIVLGIVSFIFFNFFSGSKTNKINSDIFDPNKIIVVKDGNKYGYISSEGEILIEPKYLSAGEFKGDYAVVKVENKNANNSYLGYEYQLIDKKGNIVKTSSDSMTYYSNYDVWEIDSVLFDSKLNKITAEDVFVNYINEGYFSFSNFSKQESGIIDYKGKIIYKLNSPYISVDISKSGDSEELFAIISTSSPTEQEFIISLKSGDVLFNLEQPQKNNIMKDKNGIFQCYSTETYLTHTYLYFNNNKLIYESDSTVRDLSIYDYKNQILELDYGYNYSEIGKEKRYYYYDIKNNKILNERPEIDIDNTDLNVDTTELTYGYKKFSSSGKYGLISKNNIIVPAEYDEIYFLDSNLFNYVKSKGKEFVLLKENGNVILMNLKNRKVIKVFENSYVSTYSNSTFIKINIYKDDGYSTDKYIIYNLLSGQFLETKNDYGISIYSNYIIVNREDKKVYYNTKLKEIYVAE